MSTKLKSLIHQGTPPKNVAVKNMPRPKPIAAIFVSVCIDMEDLQPHVSGEENSQCIQR